MQISVVLATYNRAVKLKNCLEALFNQTLSLAEYEVIVVDDGSFDETQQVLNQFRSGFANFSFLRQQNQGPAAARNRGVRQAKAGVVAFTDDDCVPPTDWLEALLEASARYPQAVAVGGYQEASADVLSRNKIAQFECFQTREIYQAKEDEVLDGLQTPAVVTNNMAIKKSVFDELGGFDESFPVAAGEDADLKKRITDRGYQLLYLPLRVAHQQDYSLGTFLRQSFVRGIGSRHFQKKWGRDFGRKRLLLRLVASPGQRSWQVFKASKSPAMGLLAFLQEAWGLWGQLKYDSR